MKTYVGAEYDKTSKTMVLQTTTRGVWQQSEKFKLTLYKKIEKNQFADKSSLNIQNRTKFSKSSNTSLQHGEKR